MCPNLFLSYLLLSHPAVSYVPSFFSTTAFVTDPFELVPKKGLPAQCHCSQENETKFGSEAKISSILRSKNGEVRASTRSPDRLWAGLFHRDLVSGEGRGRNSCMLDAAVPLRLQIPASGPASLHTAPRPHLEWRRPAQRFCARALRVQASAQLFLTRSSVWSAGWKASECGVLRASERLSTKGKEKKRLDFISLPRMGFAGDTFFWIYLFSVWLWFLLFWILCTHFFFFSE